MTKPSISAASNRAPWRAALMRWYRDYGRHDLPWRLTRDPYAVLVSEVMLQQTQVERVRPYYEKWLARWPHFRALAGASPAEVIRDWRGLGYNRRALNLHRLAVEVVTQHGGELPQPMTELLRLPGVGPYTASAVACFARDEPVPVADTNIARVLGRLLGGAASQRNLPPKALWELARTALPTGSSRGHNLALMDLGATVCAARSPRCDVCPMAPWCAWKRAGLPPGGMRAPHSPRFETTARFARGRIVDALREAPAGDAELRTILPAPHGEKLQDYLEALSAEGLVVKDAHGAWSLPR